MGNQQDAAMKKGPSGHGTSGFKMPGPDTLEKHRPADELSPKATGVEARGGQDVATLGALTQDDRLGETGGGIRQEFVQAAQPSAAAVDAAVQDRASARRGERPEVARAQDLSPDAEIQPRIPETERDDESPAGLGKGVAVPPGSSGRHTGQTP